MENERNYMICLEIQSPNNQDRKWRRENIKVVIEEHFLELKEVSLHIEGAFEEPGVMKEFSHQSLSFQNLRSPEIKIIKAVKEK